MRVPVTLNMCSYILAWAWYPSTSSGMINHNTQPFTRFRSAIVCANWSRIAYARITKAKIVTILTINFQWRFQNDCAVISPYYSLISAILVAMDAQSLLILGRQPALGLAELESL